MKNFKRIIALLIISTAVFGAWYDFVGQLQFDDKVAAPPVQSRGMMFYDNDKDGVAFYDSTKKISLKSLEGRASYTYKGDAELADLADWSTFGGTFSKTTVSADLVDGGKAWKWLGAVNFDSIVLNYTSPEGIQNDSQLHAYEFKYNYGGVDDDYELLANCTSPVATIVTSSDNITILQKEHVARGFFKVPKDCLAVDVGLKCVSASCDTITFNKFHIFDYTFPTVKSVESETINFSANASTMTASSGTLRFGTVESTGQSLLDYDDATGFFTAKADITINSTSISWRSNTTTNTFIEKSDGSIIYGNATNVVGRHETTNGSMFLQVGEAIRFRTDSGYDGSRLVSMNITATASSSNVVFEGATSETDIVVEGSGNNGAVMASNTTAINWTETTDNSNVWNGTQFTPSETGIYTVTANIRWTSPIGANIFLYKDGISVQQMLTANAISNNNNSFSITQVFEKDKSYTFISNTTGTLSNLTQLHWIKITKAAVNPLYSVPVTNLVENVYSARIVNNGTASIISESSPFIESVNRSALGEVTIVWKTGFFTEIPSITFTMEIIGTDNNQLLFVTSSSITQASFRIENTAGTGVDRDFSFRIQRQGTDYKAPKGYFLGKMARTAHVTGGVEYKTADTWNGKPIYARSYEVLSNLNNGTVIDTVASGLSLVDSIHYLPTYYILHGYTAGTSRAYIHYRSDTGNIVTDSSVAYQILAGTKFTIRYTK